MWIYSQDRSEIEKFKYVRFVADRIEIPGKDNYRTIFKIESDYCLGEYKTREKCMMILYEIARAINEGKTIYFMPEEC